MSLFLRVGRLYKGSVTRYPYMAQGVQSSILMATGDFISQKMVEKNKEFDFRRSANFLLIGFFGGLGLRKWYGILSNTFSKSPNKTANTIKKVAADQIIFAPLFIGVLISAIGSLQGSSPTQIRKKLEKEYPDILKTNYKIWPAVQLINFAFVPLNYQVVLVQIVAVLWNSYISFVTNNSNVEIIKEEANI